MMKAMKKLKFWSKKKRKRKNHPPYYPLPPNYPPPPPPCHHFRPYSSATEPSAPPLPPWFEAEQNYGTFSQPSFETAPEVTYPSQAKVVHQPEIVEESKPVYQNVPVERSSSYQQYMVPEPVYGIPITQTDKIERSRGLFGCVFSFGGHLFRCLFPCFHIREA